MITSGLEANKMCLRPTALLTNKAKWAFLVTFCYTALSFYDVNMTILPLDKDILAEFTKMFSMKITYQHPFVCKKFK